MKEILIFLIGFLSIKTLSDAGSFKVIESHYDGSCVEIHNISGYFIPFFLNFMTNIVFQLAVNIIPFSMPKNATW